MAVPKKKTSKSKRNQRRSHDRLSPVTVSYDSVTGEPKLPHHISLKDGYYNGKIVLIKNKKNEEEKNNEEEVKTAKSTKEVPAEK